jgi:LysR family hydrogen peroxide-inducible transcriptional activator
LVTLRQLRYLDALSQTLHFGKAADICAVSQPALSMQIKDLEDMLGVSLVERRKQGVELTEEGWEVARRARTILASVRDLMDYAKQHDEMLAGTLRLGAIPSIAPYILPKALPLIQTKFPKLRLQLRETLTETLLRELVSGELDVVLAALPIEHPDIETQHLFDDRFFLAVNAKDNRERTRATLEQLADERLLLLEEGHCLRDQALSFCQMLTPEARSTFGASSLSTIVQMVGSGFGVTLLPEMAATIEAERRDDIKLLRFEGPEPKREIGLAWRKTTPRKPDYQRFAEMLIEIGLDRKGVAAA